METGNQSSTRREQRPHVLRPKPLGKRHRGAARGLAVEPLVRIVQRAAVGVWGRSAARRIVSTLQWRSDARDEAVAKIVAALEAAGITFLSANAQGVGLRGRIKSSAS
jgi:hypothetical protein